MEVTLVSTGADGCKAVTQVPKPAPAQDSIPKVTRHQAGPSRPALSSSGPGLEDKSEGSEGHK